MSELWEKSADGINRKKRELWKKDQNNVNRKLRELWAKDGSGVNRKIFSGYDAQIHDYSDETFPGFKLVNSDGSLTIPQNTETITGYTNLLYIKTVSPVSYNAFSFDTIFSLSKIQFYIFYLDGASGFDLVLKDLKNNRQLSQRNLLDEHGTAQDISFDSRESTVSTSSDLFLLQMVFSSKDPTVKFGCYGPPGCMTIGGVQLKNVGLI